MTRRAVTVAAVLAARPSLRALQVAACPPGEREGLVRALGRREAHRAQGRAADANGRRLEAWLNDQHARALATGVAHVRKVGADVVVGRGGLPCAWAGPGPADYLGTLRGGRSLAVEAKSVAKRLSRVAVLEHQARDLERTAALGGLALLVVELRHVGPRGTVYAVEWSRVPWRVTKATICGAVQTRETVGAEELAGCEVGAGLYLGRWIDREDRT